MTGNSFWDLKMNKDFIFEEGKDYYLEDGRIILTEKYLKKRGKCCGSLCRHCPFDPAHQKGNQNFKKSSVNDD